MQPKRSWGCLALPWAAALWWTNGLGRVWTVTRIYLYIENFSTKRDFPGQFGWESILMAGCHQWQQQLLMFFSLEHFGLYFHECLYLKLPIIVHIIKPVENWSEKRVRPLLLWWPCASSNVDTGIWPVVEGSKARHQKPNHDHPRWYGARALLWTRRLGVSPNPMVCVTVLW